MTDDWQPSDEKKRSLRAPLIGAAIVALLGGGLWFLGQNISGVTRPSETAPTVNLLPPPPPAPPPPPPTKEPPPPPDHMETPKAEDQPKADNQPKQLTENGPAQAGSDSFGLAAGKGGGSVVDGGGEGDGGGGGGEFADANYRRILKEEIQQAVQADGKIDKQFATAVVAVWIDANGRVRRSKINRGSGDDKVDAAIIADLRAMPPLRDLPPPKFPFPEKVEIKGARRG